MIVPDTELLDLWTRAVDRTDRFTVECLTVTWDGPANRFEDWTVVSSPSVTSTAEHLLAYRLHLLRRRLYFKRCSNCGRLRQAGDMFDARLCHACASDVLGVVY